jgi:CspA family cold shock protein
MMVTGRIKQLVRDRGFGFITADDGSDIFFHSSGVLGIPFDSLRPGQRVSFDIEAGTKGPRAVHVQLEGAVPPR